MKLTMEKKDHEVRLLLDVEMEQTHESTYVERGPIDTTFGLLVQSKGQIIITLLKGNFVIQ